MSRLAALALLALSACAGSADNGVNLTDGGVGGDAGAQCQNVLSWDPFSPEASSIAPVRVRANIVGSPGVFTYVWSVSYGGQTVTHTQESSDNSEIGFIAPDPGIYYVSVNISGAFTDCPFASEQINVLAPGANTNVYRLRAVPPPNTGAPPQEQVIQINGGAPTFNRDVTLDPGVTAGGTVRNGSGGPGVAAYVKFMPVSTPLAFTELFATSAGSYSTKLIGVPHDVLVIPTSTMLAPKLVPWTTSTTSLVVGAGTVVNGTVLGPTGTGIIGAKVQLTSGGVPSTTGTTTSGGAFMLRADFPASTPITVKVTPPAASGLPRLEATGSFTLTTAMAINYVAGLQTCNLQNTPVRRDSVNQEGARVTVVGTLAANAGTVTAGAAANALGTVRIAASADGSGVLPSVLVPRASTLSAVVELGLNDFAVDPIDTSTCSALVIDAPPLIVANGVVKNPSNAVLGGVRVEATPLGVMALADAQTVSTTTNASGAFSLSLAAGGRYDVRFVDPFARVARREESNITAPSIPTNAILPLAIALSGQVSIAGSSQPLPGTAIHLLCTQCSGVDAARPIAETATSSASTYRIAVPDPGTM